MNHGMNTRCLNCHDGDDRDKLVLHDGTTGGFAETPALAPRTPRHGVSRLAARHARKDPRLVGRQEWESAASHATSATNRIRPPTSP